MRLFKCPYCSTVVAGMTRGSLDEECPNCENSVSGNGERNKRKRRWQDITAHIESR